MCLVELLFVGPGPCRLGHLRLRTGRC
jgi:hypothetical protein